MDNVKRKSNRRVIVMLNERQMMMMEEIKRYRGYNTNADVIRFALPFVHETLWGKPKDTRERSLVHESDKPVKLTKEEKAEQDRKAEQENLTRIVEDELKGVCIRDDEDNLIGAHVFQYEGRTRIEQRLNVNEIESFGEIQYLPSKVTFDAKMKRLEEVGVVLNYDPNETMAQHMGLDK